MPTGLHIITPILHQLSHLKYLGGLKRSNLSDLNHITVQYMHRTLFSSYLGVGCGLLNVSYLAGAPAGHALSAVV